MYLNLIKCLRVERWMGKKVKTSQPRFLYSATCSMYKGSIIFTSSFSRFAFAFRRYSELFKAKLQLMLIIFFCWVWYLPEGVVVEYLILWNNWGDLTWMWFWKVKAKNESFILLCSQPVEDRRRVRAILPYTKVPDTDEIRYVSCVKGDFPCVILVA